MTDGSYLYAIGGTGTSIAHTTVYSAQIQGGGALGPWATTVGLPAARTQFAAVVFGGYLYVMGGLDAAGNPVGTVWSAPIGGGTVGSYTTLPSLPASTSYHMRAAVW